MPSHLAFACFASHRLWGRGLTLYELAEILILQNVSYAMNLDGGGSSVLARREQGQQQYTIVSRPTCLDVPMVVCERAVSTTICLRDPKAEQKDHCTTAHDHGVSWYPLTGGVPVLERFLSTPEYVMSEDAADSDN